MKKTRVLILVSLFISLFSATLNARDIVLKQALSFADAVELVDMLDKPEETILVMDDDDTLTMMQCNLDQPLTNCQYLGGPAWFAWQNDLLKSSPDSSFLVAKNEEGLIDVSSHLISLSNMTYTSDIVPDVLRTLTNKGVRLMVETARGVSEIEATKRQLSALSIPTARVEKQSLANLISENALLSNKHDIANFEKNCSPEGGTPIVYQEGAAYVSGQNKGEILKCMTDLYNVKADKNSKLKRIKNVIFLDDDFNNAQNVYRAYRGSKKYNVFALNYVLLKEHKEAFSSGKNSAVFQEIANKRWNALKESKK